MNISLSACACGVLRKLTASTALALALVWSSPVLAQTDAFTRALAEAAAPEAAVAAFYRDQGYKPLWAGPADQNRRQALIRALSTAGAQGLPISRYDPAALIALAKAAVTEGDRGRFEVAMTTAYLAYARDVASGVLTPKKIDPTIVREILRPDPAVLLSDMAAAANPDAYLAGLLPKAPEYARLMKEKLRLERQSPSSNGISAAKLAPGDSGDAVVVMRNRLIELGYLARSATASYDSQMQRAVQRYQLDQGLTADGVAGNTTIAALNTPPAERIKSVLVALERMRWMGQTNLGKRHIWVNLPDFTAKIVDDGRVTFQTRSVVGKSAPDMRTPEFSDEMEYMVINPSWGVPRSIIVKEYLPLLQRNRNAVGHLQVIDGKGRVVPRGAVNFAGYTASSFPFGLRQPPSDGNALGKVKFMFPNQYNIYLHDTPAKALFANEVRAFSHGCIRLSDPFDFAYTLLARQSADPKALFQDHLDSTNESTVSLDVPLPVHLVYYTAWPTKTGMGYRRDIYGRDGALFDALSKAGVALPQMQG